MKYPSALFLITQIACIPLAAAQAIYGPNGNYVGYGQTSPSGIPISITLWVRMYSPFKPITDKRIFIVPRVLIRERLLHLSMLRPILI